jgi:branched-chain amino acid transport system substrate-binding protein
MLSLGKFAHAASALAAAASLAAFSTIAQAQDKGPIRIGFLPPITGPLASPGAEMVNGFRLFWEQAGMTAGGRKIRSRSSPATRPVIRIRR